MVLVKRVWIFKQERIHKDVFCMRVIMTLIDYRYCVYKMAKSLGYSDSEIEAFKYDIDEC